MAGLLLVAGLLGLIGWVMAREMRLRPHAGVFRPVMLGFLPFAAFIFGSALPALRDPELAALTRQGIEADLARYAAGDPKADPQELKRWVELLVRLQAGLACVMWLGLCAGMAALIRRRLARSGQAAPLAPLSRWKAPEGLVWAGLLPAALVLFGDRGWLGLVEPWLRDGALNLLVVVGAAYFVQGLLILVERLAKAGLPKYLGSLLALICMAAAGSPKGKPVAFAILALGLLETWFDFRGLAPKEEESERSGP